MRSQDRALHYSALRGKNLFVGCLPLAHAMRMRQQRINIIVLSAMFPLSEYDEQCRSTRSVCSLLSTPTAATVTVARNTEYCLTERSAYAHCLYSTTATMV